MAARGSLDLPACDRFHGLTEVLAMCVEILHHLEELKPVNSAVRVFVNTFEQIGELFVAHVGVAQAGESLFELTCLNRAVAVCIEVLEGVDHATDLLRIKVLPVDVGHFVRGCCCCFNHSVAEWRVCF